MFQYNKGYQKTLRIREGVHESRYSFEIFVSHGTDKMRRGTLLCFRKSLVTKFLRIGDWGGEEGSIRISFRKFLSHSDQTFVGELVSVSINSGIEKIHA